MKKTILIFFLFKIGLTFGQSKKEQIEMLKMRTDSIANVLDNEREMNVREVQEHIYINGLAQNKIDSLLIELKKINNVYDKILSENTSLKNDLNLNLNEISKLKTQLINKTDSLIIISNELKYIKTKVQTANFNIAENNFDNLFTKFINQEKNTIEYNNWIEKIVLKDVDGDSSYFTKKCLAFINDVIDNNWGYDGSIDDKTLKKKWENLYDLKYSNFGHLFETGNGGWGTKKLTKIEYLGELNNGDWFKLTIKGGNGANDFSTTLVRIIKVVKKGDTFYIDNFLGLSEN